MPLRHIHGAAGNKQIALLYLCITGYRSEQHEGVLRSTAPFRLEVSESMLHLLSSLFWSHFPLGFCPVTMCLTPTRKG